MGNHQLDQAAEILKNYLGSGLSVDCLSEIADIPQLIADGAESQIMEEIDALRAEIESLKKSLTNPKESAIGAAGFTMLTVELIKECSVILGIELFSIAVEERRNGMIVAAEGKVTLKNGSQKPLKITKGERRFMVKQIVNQLT